MGELFLHRLRSKIRFRSIRTAFIVTFIAPFLLAGSFLTMIVLQGSREAVDDVIVELRETIFDLVDNELTSKLSEANRLNRTHSQSWYRGQLLLHEQTSRERYFVTALESLPNAAMTFIGLEDGQFYGARRMTTGEIEVVRNNQQTGQASEYYSISELGDGEELVARFENFDPRVRPWYMKAKESKGPVYSDIYSHFVFQEPTITASMPIYNNDELVGVFGVDLLLTWLGETLRELPIGTNGCVFIVDQNGKVIATSTEDSIFRVVDNTSVLIKAAESNSEIIRHICQLPEESFDARSPYVKILDNTYLINKGEFQEYGLNWDIYIALAGDDFLQQMNYTVSRVLLQIALFIGVFIGFAFWFSNRTTKPIIELNEAAKKLANGEFSKIKVDEGLDEIAELTKSFNLMGIQLTGLVSHLESEVQNRTAELQNALEAKSEFLANMSHEIRSPMNVIIGMSELVLESDLKSENREYVTMVNESAKMLLSVINQILDYSKMEAGRLTLNKAPFSLQAAIDQVVKIHSFTIREYNIEVITIHDQQIPEWLIGDKARLQQVLINLIGNAIKFTDQGSITVSTEILEQDNQNARIKISVQDTGIGIPANKIDNLFQSFSQVDSSLARKYEGTGLGLAISQKLINMMGGQIEVITEVGQGSTFYFTLEFQKTTAPESDLNIKSSQGTDVQKTQDPDLQYNEQPASILLVEDKKMNQRLAKVVLEKMGWQVSIAENGKQALDMLETESFDLILMDIQMPVMDGIETTKRIRRLSTSKPELALIPIIAMTANVMEGDKEKCLEIGMNDYISKPFVREQVYQIIKKNLPPR
ncbi:ATP-binding protein [Desulfuribacillus alkaliarsenatis]|uniref:Circadian input-output histidine kinase CikA n=1 Tax=Desulfuribacillus alkaliarsenatis TaxID=766136 RepID=A0A1E5G0X8_9FIRM|nr:ATP-binding protein [Desulfuribacillus alkaliarsenatis]OEF96565.1 hypothetical protein BHF68_07925 [Desulfuribacillus alkaliarsenatis]